MTLVRLFKGFASTGLVQNNIMQALYEYHALTPENLAEMINTFKYPMINNGKVYSIDYSITQEEAEQLIRDFKPIV